MYDFQDKTLLLTGANGGIGREVAKLFYAGGANLVLTDLDLPGLESFAADLGADAGKRVVTQRMAALLDSDAEIWAFDAKPLYRLALEQGHIGKALHFDGKLAAYLLNPSASSYAVKSLAAEYGVAAAFHCEAAPDAGVLAALTWSASALQWTPTASAPLATACGASWTASCRISTLRWATSST